MHACENVIYGCPSIDNIHGSSGEISKSELLHEGLWTRSGSPVGISKPDLLHEGLWTRMNPSGMFFGRSKLLNAVQYPSGPFGVCTLSFLPRRWSKISSNVISKVVLISLPAGILFDSFSPGWTSFLQQVQCIVRSPKPWMHWLGSLALAP